MIQSMARLPTLAGLALTVAVLAGCGGGDDQGKVEAGLQHYLESLSADRNPFPIGAGVPSVKDNGCFKAGAIRLKVLTKRKPSEGRRVAVWHCVVKFGKSPMPVAVALDGTKVIDAWPVSRVIQTPARTYTG
jgi:hypothetical protein